MQDIVALFIIILISYIIVSYFDNKKEHYVTSIVGYNNIEIPKYYIPNVFNSETTELVKLLKDKFSDDNVEPLGFKEHNPYIPFPFEASIKKSLIDYMNTNIGNFKGHNLGITSDLNKLYYKESGNDRIFIFNISLVDNTQFMTTNLRIKLKIKDINNFIRGVKTEQSEIDYRTDIPPQTIINASEILSIRVDENNYDSFKLNGIDSLRPNYYEIKNILGLMDPFLTSSRDMIITDKMRTDFDKEINKL